MADPLSKLGFSRRPAYELFGTPDISRSGWSQGTRQAVAEEQMMADEEAAAEEERAALEDQRIARQRQREAENLADTYTQIRNPSAREKFFEENAAGMTGSRRYSELAEIQRREPSYADKTLANNLAMKIDDPDERNVFLQAVSSGIGTLAAREEADRFRLKRQQAAKLGEAGFSPDEAEEALAKRYDDAHVNYLISQKKGGGGSGGTLRLPPEVQALERQYEWLENRIKNSPTGLPDPTLLEKRDAVAKKISDFYDTFTAPPPVIPPPGGVTPAPLPTTSAEAKAALLKKLGITK